MANEYEKVCEAALRFDYDWMKQPCSDRMGVLTQMGEWYRSGLHPTSIQPAKTAVEKEAQEIYPKYYAHFMSMAGPPATIPPGFFDLEASKAKHCKKPMLHQKLGVADDAMNALFHWISAKQPKKAPGILKELLARFDKWTTEPNFSFKEQDMKATNIMDEGCAARYWPLFAAFALARGTDAVTLDTAKYTAAVGQPFVKYEDPQMGMAKMLHVSSEHCAPLFELLELLRTIHDTKFASEFEVAITQLASRSAPLPSVVARLAAEAFPISTSFYQKQLLLAKKFIH